MPPRPPSSSLFPYTTLFRSYGALWNQVWSFSGNTQRADVNQMFLQPFFAYQATRTLTVTLQSESTANWKVEEDRWTDRKSTRLNSSHSQISYAVFCLKKKKH